MTDLGGLQRVRAVQRSVSPARIAKQRRRGSIAVQSPVLGCDLSGMPPAPIAVCVPAYISHDPNASVFYTVVHEPLETFRAEAARLCDGTGLPRFVEGEFRAFLRCGGPPDRASNSVQRMPIPAQSLPPLWARA